MVPDLASAPAPSMSKGKKIALITAAVIIAPLAVYFAFSWATGAQRRVNEARANDEDRGLVGEELGHVAELNRVMEMTDNASVSGAAEEAALRKQGWKPGMPLPASAQSIIPAIWTLDLDKAEIPPRIVAGKVAGTSFIARYAEIHTGSGLPTLAFRSAENMSPEQQILVQIRLKPGEKLEGNSWTITKDQAKGGPLVVKRWRPRPSDGLIQKEFAGGYALKLEFGQPDRGSLPGKIFIALPDAEQTVAGGNFSARIRVASPAGAGRGSSSGGMDE